MHDHKHNTAATHKETSSLAKPIDFASYTADPLYLSKHRFRNSAFNTVKCKVHLCTGTVALYRPYGP